MGISNAIPAMLLLACLTPQPSAQTRPNDPLQEAESLLEKQQYDLAEGKLKILVNGQSENPQAWFDLGFAENHLGKTLDAIAAYKKAAELSPKWFEANLNLGLALAKNANVGEAAKVLRTTIQLKPTTGGPQAVSKAWLALGQVLEESDPKESLNAYQKSSELDPKNPEAYLGVGKMLERTGDLPGAEKQYLTAVNMQASGSVERLIKMYLEHNRLADAESWLKKYAGLYPENMSAQVMLSKVFAAEGKTQDAIAMLEVVDKKTADPGVSRELALLYSEAKQYEAAARLLRPLAEKNPADTQLHWYYGEALFHQRKYAEAEPELLKALQQKPDLAEAYGDLAFAAEQNKHYELAVRALDLRAKYLPEIPATYFIRATAYDNMNASKPAAENYKLFLAAAGGKFPDQEFQARHRLKAIEPK
jgi:tetratricopeptide (TPR) repeat protein